VNGNKNIFVVLFRQSPGRKLRAIAQALVHWPVTAADWVEAGQFTM